MARRSHEPSDTLEELASIGDRLAAWVADHATLVVGIGVGILVLAAAAGGVHSYRIHRAEAASEALSELRVEFVTAMGGTPGTIELPEPMNPETARNLRVEFAGQYLDVAARHEGTAAAGLAHLEAGDLLADAGDPDGALDAWKAGLEQTEAGPLEGALWSRIAVAEEEAERFREAAEAHARAGAIESFPLAPLARVRAAWCWAEAGEPERALATYLSLKQEAPDFQLPEHLEARLREIEVLAGS